MLGDQTVYVESGFKTLRILILPKALRRQLVLPVHRVVVHGKPVEIPAPGVWLVGLHDSLSPFTETRFIPARANRDLQHLLASLLLRGIEVPDEVAVNLELAQI